MEKGALLFPSISLYTREKKSGSIDSRCRNKYINVNSKKQVSLSLSRIHKLTISAREHLSIFYACCKEQIS